MEVIVNILLFILILGFIVFVHELGHFTWAKICGVYVYEFALGMGPKIWSKKGKETTYSIRAVPIGGFCAMVGEDEKSDDVNAFGNKPVLDRILVVVAGPAFNFILANIFNNFFCDTFYFFFCFFFIKFFICFSYNFFPFIKEYYYIFK